MSIFGLEEIEITAIYKNLEEITARIKNLQEQVKKGKIVNETSESGDQMGKKKEEQKIKDRETTSGTISLFKLDTGKWRNITIDTKEANAAEGNMDEVGRPTTTSANLGTMSPVVTTFLSPSLN